MKSLYKRMFLIALCAVIYNNTIHSQSVIPCYTDEAYIIWINEHPEALIKENEDKKAIQDYLNANKPEANKVLALKTVPVVVHVFHKGEAVGVGTNISKAQIDN